FRVGEKRIVVSAHLVQDNDAKVFTNWSSDLDTIHLNHGDPMMELTLEKVSPTSVQSVRRVALDGSSLPLTPETAPGGGLLLRVPIRDEEGGAAREWFRDTEVLTFFVEVKLK
ncbi:MAG: hypothetical protein Q7Q73_08830, partial [Verrucomicrobiota bacterium JB024]|nr:hypothetical protein [Verrucomicrobiota bacterium JB024]